MAKIMEVELRIAREQWIDMKYSFFVSVHWYAAGLILKMRIEKLAGFFLKHCNSLYHVI